MANPLIELSRQGYRSFTQEELDDRLFQEPPHGWPPTRPTTTRQSQTVATQPRRPPIRPARYDAVGADDNEEWPDIEPNKGHSRHSHRPGHSGGYTPVQVLLGLIVALVVLTVVGLLIYVVVISVHSDGSKDESSDSVSPAGMIQAEVLETVIQSPLDQYHRSESDQQLSREAKAIASLSYAFTVGSELQVLERHPPNGSLLSIPYDSLRFYTVCCNVKSKNFVCLGGMSYSAPGLAFEASLNYDQSSNEVYLSLWVNGKDLLGAGCYAHISYLPP
jgi:hypothetical protein